MEVDIVAYRVRIGLHHGRHLKIKGITCLNNFDYYTWLRMLLTVAGDIESNPGPKGDSFASDSDSDTSYSDMLKNNFSVVHYNVQSAYHKMDILETELSCFDIISFSETWFNSNVDSSEVSINGFRAPFRNDRTDDGHGGVAVYVKYNIPCLRRHDLEMLNVESVWLEVRLKSKRILVGTFYRPPNSNQSILTDIERSVDLAVDTRISDIIILGDFNLDMLKLNSRRKIENICQQYDLKQVINEPTHFTESSSSLIDIILVSDIKTVLFSGVGDPFLNNEVRYHCPILAVFTFPKTHNTSFKRLIWKYKDGDYDSLNNKIANTDWNSFKNSNIDTYASNITNHIMKLSKECIPNKVINVRNSDPPWMHNELRKLMRKRKRAYDNAKRTKNPQHWTAYKKLRNDTTAMLRSSKKNILKT